ncbi:MAG TPA: hypothetical protein PK919_06230 [Candidatus Aminicenantes bacterium]|nr:hypothetical protein [Candidatus Aminicenantes bacterium]
MRPYRITLMSLLVLVAVAAAVLLLSLGWGASQDLRRQGRGDPQAALRRQEQELAQTAAEHKEWQRLPEDLRRFRERTIITLDGFARFRRDLNLCLDDNNLRAPNISFNFQQRQNGLQPVAMQFSLNGPYRSLKKFIYDMERKPQMAFIRSVDMSASGDAVNAHFSMEAYLGD